MNRKIYLAAALATSLAACTNEADLLSQDAQNGVSPISFVLDLNEEPGSRNVWGGSDPENQTTVMWDKDTHLSLFNGGDASTGTFGTNTPNAIYKANAGSSEGKLSFSTQSMVLPGQAIMVHPADTIFSMTTGQLYVNSVVNVPAEGDDILHRMPFISEGIEIGGYNENSGIGAGYGKEYDVKLRQIGSLLRLRFNWTGYDVIEELLAAGTISQGITIDQVSLNRTEKFNSKLAIALADKGALGSNWGEVDRYNTWNKISTINVDPTVLGNEQVGTLTSKDYTYENDEVRFMLLPQQHVVNTPGADGKPVFTADENSSIVIDTYYGTLTLDKNSGKVFPANAETDDKYYYTGALKGKPAMSVAEGLNYIVAFTNLPKLGTTSTFAGEVVGQTISRNVNADLAKLNMSTVHIKNEQHLLDVFYVHKALQPSTSVEFYIDGDENNEFVMSASTVALLNEWNADPTTGNITLKLCKKAGEECDAIRLTGNGGEIPAYTFVTTWHDLILNQSNGKAWSWTGGVKTYNCLSSFTNAGGLKFVDGAEVKFAGVKTTFVFNNKGTINVNGSVKLSAKTFNYGTINVKESAILSNNAEFTNEATKLDEFGKIYNYGTFANINTGVINNYGYIEQMTATSKTFITSNQTTSVAFNAIWSDTNKYGTIKLFDKDDDNYSVYNSENQGFIMIETDAATVTAEEIGTQANYVKISGDCTKLDFTRTGSINSRVLFIEIASSKEVEWTTTGTKIRGLIVNEGCNLYIKKNNTVEVIQGTFLKGTISKGGEFTEGSFVTYFGGATTDAENVLKWQ